MKIRKEIAQIKDAIITTMPVEQIYLFGSYAKGTEHEESDYDFYVVVPDNGVRPLEAMQKLGAAIGRVQKKPVDLLVGKRSNFDSRKLLPTIEREVDAEGIKIYG
jgi:predicted nucleotidyltransferase